MAGRICKIAGIVAAAGLLGGSFVLGPATAEAKVTDKGVVTADWVNLRYSPSAATKKVGEASKGETLPLVCAIRGSSVTGNDRWYLVVDGAGADSGAGYRSGGNTHVTAKYVKVTAPSETLEQMRPSRDEPSRPWVSARYVRNIGAVPEWCD